MYHYIESGHWTTETKFRDLKSRFCLYGLHVLSAVYIYIITYEITDLPAECVDWEVIENDRSSYMLIS